MFTPRDAFLLAFHPSVLGIRLENRQVLDGLVGEEEPKLRHAVEFSAKTQTIGEAQQRDAESRIEDLARRAGLVLPAPPATAEEHAAWRAALGAAARPLLEGDLAPLAWEVGEAACDLHIAVWVLRNLLYLRTAAPEHAGLRAQADERVRAIAGGTRRLEQATGSVSGRPAVAAAGAALGQLLLGAPDLAQVTTTAGFKAFFEWARRLDGGFAGLADAFEAPEPAPPSTPEEDALLAEILARPEDDAPRLRWAELAARRKEPRAQLVHDQMRMRDLRRGGERRAEEVPHLVRAKQLVAAHPEWSREVLALGATAVRLHRGFVDEVSLDAATFLSRAGEIYRVAPVVRLRLLGAGGRGAELAASPHLARIIALDLAQNGIADEDVTALAVSPNVARLRHLDLSRNRITDRGVEALAASRQLGALESLLLQGNPCHDPVDRQAYIDETRFDWVPSDAGRALEAEHGRLAWLHPPAEGWFKGWEQL